MWPEAPGLALVAWQLAISCSDMLRNLTTNERINARRYAYMRCPTPGARRSPFDRDIVEAPEPLPPRQPRRTKADFPNAPSHTLIVIGP
ncbi:hypothetical protein T484DRAFT_1766790 [Baffinella frigidus]|nr:hypothetical protein T484DRAFT_1766790 [Cryptophyta sp. CCMP2293]